MQQRVPGLHCTLFNRDRAKAIKVRPLKLGRSADAACAMNNAYHAYELRSEINNGTTYVAFAYLIKE